MKFITLVTSLVLCISATAQIERGTWMVSTRLLPLPTSGLNLQSELGLSYFALKNTSVGLRNQSKLRLAFSPSYFSFGNEGSVFTRYYIPLSKRVSLFAESSASIGRTRIHLDEGVCTQDIYKLSTTMGIAYWINSWLNIEGRVNYNWRWQTAECGYSGYLGRDITANVALNFYFTRLLELKRR